MSTSNQCSNRQLFLRTVFQASRLTQFSTKMEQGQGGPAQKPGANKRMQQTQAQVDEVRICFGSVF